MGLEPAESPLIDASGPAPCRLPTGIFPGLSKSSQASLGGRLVGFAPCPSYRRVSSETDSYSLNKETDSYSLSGQTLTSPQP